VATIHTKNARIFRAFLFSTIEIYTCY
jgi:hypothetical protein